MLLKCFFVCLIVKQILGVPVDNEGTSNYLFEDEIMKAFEVLRKIMKEGDTENGIPPMEPLRLPNFTFDFYLEDTALKGSLRNTVVRNLSDFQVKNVTLNISPSVELKLKVLFDQVYITGYYNLLGTLFGEYPVKGLGTHKIKLNGFEICTDVGLRSKAGIPNIKHLNASFNVEGVSVSFVNLLEGEHEQSMKQEITLHLLDRFQAEYLPLLLNTLKIIVNDFMVKIFLLQDAIPANILEYLCGSELTRDYLHGLFENAGIRNFCSAL